MIELIRPQWPAPAWVQAVVTTRIGGMSQAPYSQCNLGLHVGDTVAAVEQNRAQLAEQLGLPAPVQWLNQSHGVAVAHYPADRLSENPFHNSSLNQSMQNPKKHGTSQPIVASTVSLPAQDADAFYTDQQGSPGAVMTADCLPVILVSEEERELAVVHAGWRGLARGVLAATLAHFRASPSDIIAWLGPAIGPRAFEVGEDVWEAFTQQQASLSAAFTRSSTNRWLADIYQLARAQLAALGVSRCFGGEFCTYTQADKFFSYRRDGETGRMATIAWIAD